MSRKAQQKVSRERWRKGPGRRDPPERDGRNEEEDEVRRLERGGRRREQEFCCRRGERSSQSGVPEGAKRDEMRLTMGDERQD